MKNNNRLSFVFGMITGSLILSCTAFAAAAGIVANPTTSPIYVDGERVQMETYNIGGFNFFKLRDMAQAVDFGVYWDNNSGIVQIDTMTGYKADNTVNADSSINLADTGEQYVPKAGDSIRCEDGTNYTITDVSRWDANAFAAGSLGVLPSAACDWSQFPKLELPDATVRHFVSGDSDYLIVRNLYETRRMQYTLYNAVGSNSETWENGHLKLSSKGNPLCRIALTIPDSKLDSAQSFWPWRAEELTRVFESMPVGSFSVEAWDMYKDGMFLRTEYYVYAI
jgi:hypothetical protein